MADGNYDNTNSGVFFEPHDDQQFVGSGRLNIDGRDFPIMVIKHPLKRDGEPTMVLYARIGVLFPNRPKDGETLNEKAPQFSGPVDLGENLRVAGWTGNKDGRRYVSLRVSDQSERKDSGSGAPDWSGGGRQAGPQSGSPADGFDDEIGF